MTVLEIIVLVLFVAIVAFVFGMSVGDSFAHQRAEFRANDEQRQREQSLPFLVDVAAHTAAVDAIRPKLLGPHVSRDMGPDCRRVLVGEGFDGQPL